LSLFSVVIVAVKGSHASAEISIVTCGLLILACLALATVGGLGAIFSVFVSPQIRCYNRIVVFIDAFSLFAIGVWIARKEKGWLQALGKSRMAMCVCVFGILGIADEQRATTYLNNGYAANNLRSSGLFVSLIEQRLGGTGAIFQIPYTPFPLDNHPGKMGPYDSAVGYLLSDHLKWSWGGFMGRTQAQWLDTVSHLPTDAMATLVARKGFSGIWVDRNGYNAKELQSFDTFAVTLGDRAIRSADGAFMFFDLRGYQGENIRNFRPLSGFTRLGGMTSRSCECYVDSITDLSNEMSRIEVTNGGILEIAGWAADVQSGFPGTGAKIVLSSPKYGSFFINAGRADRPDVAAAFSKTSLMNAGVVGAGILQDIPRGEYGIHLQIDANAVLECDSHKTVTIQ
jgi:hypothetical protein